MSFWTAVRKKPATTSGAQMHAYAASASPSGPRASGAASTKAAHSTGTQLIADARRTSTFLQHDTQAYHVGCRFRKVKVYITVNIMLHKSEEHPRRGKAPGTYRAATSGV